jgi:quercetin dioxygenase-like cupin family protein
MAPKGGPDVAKEDAGADVEALQIQTIAGALNEFGPAVHTCWAHAAADDFRVNGQVVLDLQIGEGGEAKVSVTTDEVRDAVLTDCMISLWSAFQWPSSFAPGDRIQLPPFEFVAPDAQYVVASDHVASVTIPNLKMQSVPVLTEANTGNANASLSTLTFGAGERVPLHSHQSAALLFVLSGTGLVEGVGAPQKIGPGSAIYVAAKTIHGLTWDAASDASVLEFHVPGLSSNHFKQAAAGGSTEMFVGRIPKRGARPLVRAVGEAEAHRLLDGKAEVRILFEESNTKDKAGYLGALTAQPGAVVPLHRHSGSSEYLFVIEGEAEMSVAGKVIPVRAGDGIQIPPGVEHGVSISGAGTFKAIQYYTPAGPEQRFKAGGK